MELPRAAARRRGRRAAAPAGADRARRPRRLLHDQGAGLPLRRGAHDPGRGRRSAAVDDAARERHRPGHGVRVAAQHDAASWTPASTCSTATCSRSRRGRTGSASRRISGRPDGQTIGNVSNWLRDVTPLTANPDYKSELRRRVQAPAAALRALRGDRAAVPGDRRDRHDAEQDERLPAQGAGDDRPGHRRQSAVVVSSAAWGHEGGNGITVEFVNRAGRRPAAGGRGQRPRRCASCWPRTRPARWPAPRRRSRPRSRPARRA